MKKVLYLILAGIAIGIFIAPAKGSETWQKLKDGLQDLKDEALDQVNDVVNQGNDLVNNGKNAVSKTIEGTQRVSNEW